MIEDDTVVERSVKVTSPAGQYLLEYVKSAFGRGFTHTGKLMESVHPF
jgi:hypothetical protein